MTLTICPPALKFACPPAFSGPHVYVPKIILIATSGDTENSKHTHTKGDLFIYSAVQRQDKKITVILYYHCGYKHSQWLALQWFGSLGCCGEARLNDLHRVVVSYRPALKALAAHAETQAEEMGLEISARHTMWWRCRTRLIADRHV